MATLADSSDVQKLPYTNELTGSRVSKSLHDWNANANAMMLNMTIDFFIAVDFS